MVRSSDGGAGAVRCQGHILLHASTSGTSPPREPEQLSSYCAAMVKRLPPFGLLFQVLGARKGSNLNQPESPEARRPRGPRIREDQEGELCAEHCVSLLSLLVEGGELCMSGDHVAMVLANPDDETISCGAALARLDGATFVLVTDGAPRDEWVAHRRGFVDWYGYAAARWRELETALAIAGIAVEQRLRLAQATRRELLFLVRSC